MRFAAITVLTLSALGAGWKLCSARPALANPVHRGQPAALAAAKGAQWLAGVQGGDGGWGQDGGATSNVRNGERLETSGNDVANTAVAALALVRAGNTPSKGPHRLAVLRAVEFVLRHVERSPEAGLTVTDGQGTQIQRKLGPFIDTFLTSMLLAELDGQMIDSASNQRVRHALQKCVAKIEKNQQGDGSWNLAGGWAPILGTSMASRSLYAAQEKGVRVDNKVLGKVADYTKQNAAAKAGTAGGVYRASPAAAGVPLYQSAQALEEMSRTEGDRRKNESEIRAITRELSSDRFVKGYGSMGGEEFFSYLNISDSMRRAGGEGWTNWNGQIQAKLVDLQNADGTWAGHHCITGRVAVTSAAILTLLADGQPAPAAAFRPVKK